MIPRRVKVSEISKNVWVGIVIGISICVAVVTVLVVTTRLDGGPTPATTQPDSNTTPPSDTERTYECYESTYYTRFVANESGSLFEPGSPDTATYSLHGTWRPVVNGYVPITGGLTVTDTPDVTNASDCNSGEMTKCVNVYYDKTNARAYCDILGEDWCVVGNDFCMTKNAYHNNRVHVDGLEYDGYFTQP